MSIQVHVENSNLQEENEKMVQDLLILLALKRLVLDQG